MGPKFSHKCPYKREAEGDDPYRTERKVMWRWWWRLEWCGHVPRHTSSHHKLEGQRMGSFPRASEGHVTCQHLVSGHLASRSWDSEFLLFSAVEFVVIGYSSPRTLTQVFALWGLVKISRVFVPYSACRVLHIAGTQILEYSRWLLH